MQLASLVQAGTVIFVAFVTAVAALLAAVQLGGRRGSGERGAPPEIAFLFDGGALVDATPGARRLLQFAATRGDDMARLVAFLSPRFPDLNARVQACGEEDRMLLLSEDHSSRLRIEATEGRLRIALEEVEEDLSDPPDRNSFAVLSAELEAHRAASDHMPVPVWRTDQAGRLTWANGAYWALAERADRVADTPPGRVPMLFPDLGDTALSPGASRRLELALPAEGTLYFDATMATVGGDRLFSALPADAIVGAERNLREFVQTLTQTFAHLSVGLAIFDRRRELTLFNPALGDLLGLEMEFLIARPGLIRFLDQLRERHMMPEPKDYKTWRQHMSDLEAAAAGGGHSETWPLPDGRTFRITGRPHPDGAVAFLFEDISAEIRLSREYRAELDLGKAVIDMMDEAIAVFSPDGRLSFANRAYARLWGLDTVETGASGPSFVDASRRWQQKCMPSPVWGDARDFAAEMSGRTTWHAEVRLKNGRKLACRFEPLPGGATMAGFSEQAAVAFPSQGAEANGTASQASARV
ncbi:PAS-domain containing protein [Psychromarinibacter sp. C21-152]|uniref:PAS-domain containing protein n=1 Tax=Psychromarinibacter sediminicola TaxID=3033385 RepID=A0AAE3TB59_9RHOB|nr:PAS-domain containing protein [Psychromarinibacter sediminicola]MDF0602335.1 PAS-domain containing protein [Psychromarinibacter sediminicola]